MSDDQGRVITDGHCLRQAHRYDLTLAATGRSPERTARHLTHSAAARQTHWTVPAPPAPAPPAPAPPAPASPAPTPVRRRFWGEAAAATLTTTLAVWLLTAPHDVARITGQPPHEGATASDWALVAFVTLVAATSASMAAGERRRPRP
jgi:hypothetical protein